jgi:hypothetical protein
MSKDLMDKILKASAVINLGSRSGGGNYMVVSKVVADVITGFRRSNRKEKIMRIFNESS